MTIRPDSNHKFPLLNDGVHDLALGNGTQFRVGIVNGRTGLFLGIVGHGAYEFCVPACPGYVEDKLSLLEGDAMNLADFINDQTFSDTETRYGEYSESLCETFNND
jgi:hypothetical protein